jgi:hypothetical protein
MVSAKVLADDVPSFNEGMLVARLRWPEPRKSSKTPIAEKYPTATAYGRYRPIYSLFPLLEHSIGHRVDQCNRPSRPQPRPSP